MPAFESSSGSEAFRWFCFGAGRLSALLLPVLSPVPRKAATANAAPHTNARAALTVLNPLPASPRKSPQTTDKLTNVTPAVTHFMEPYPVPEKVRVSVRCQQSPAFCQGIRP